MSVPESGFPTTRTSALERWQAFRPRVAQYRDLRDKVVPGHPHVTRLSPALRTRLVTTEELVDSLLTQDRLEAVEKLVQELVWRDYWKGWLEMRPGVWSAYRDAVDRVHHHGDPGLLRRAEEVMAGRGGIAVMDGFARELVQTGYLHNHARMWWAGYWIHVERLPWVLGADFFHRHLLDADPASNTLGWRWVAGLHTRGKAYLPRRGNLERHCSADLLSDPTGLGRLEAPEALLEAGSGEVPPGAMPWTPLSEEPRGLAAEAGRWGLWVHDEDLSVERSRLGGLRPGCVLAAWDRSQAGSLRLSPLRVAYLQSALADGLARAGRHFGCPTESRESEDDLGRTLATVARERGLSGWVALRPAVGPLADAIPGIEATLAREGRRIVWCRRRWDEDTWPLASGGFFGFWDKVRPRLVARGQTPREPGPTSR